MRVVIFCLFFICHSAFADTMLHFMNIANQIPKMEMKADPQAQAWARSARNVLIITCESIAETIIEANDYAKKQGTPLFCMHDNNSLSATVLNELIQKTYKELAVPQKQKDSMTVSQLAWVAMQKNYPCKQKNTQRTTKMQHMSALLNHK